MGILGPEKSHISPSRLDLYPQTCLSNLEQMPILTPDPHPATTLFLRFLHSPTVGEHLPSMLLSPLPSPGPMHLPAHPPSWPCLSSDADLATIAGDLRVAKQRGTSLPRVVRGLWAA